MRRPYSADAALGRKEKGSAEYPPEPSRPMSELSPRLWTVRHWRDSVYVTFRKRYWSASTFAFLLLNAARWVVACSRGAWCDVDAGRCECGIFAGSDMARHWQNQMQSRPCLHNGVPARTPEALRIATH